MKKANYAAIYCGLYPQLAETVRKHGYALAVHGSLITDFDLICIPWVSSPSEPKEVVEDIVTTFALKQAAEPDTVEHGRERWPIQISFGSCRIDLSFMPRST
jgi:hypothetical protein